MTRTARSVLITVAVIVLAFLLWRLSEGVSSQPVVKSHWLQTHKHSFYALKSLIAVAGVLLTLLHMNHIWGRNMRIDQRFRYFTLFYFGALIAITSAQQAQAKVLPPIVWWNILAFVGVILLCFTAVISMRYEKRPLT